MKLTRYRPWSQFLSLLLAFLMTTQLALPALALEDTPPEPSLLGAEAYTYTEVTDPADLTSGGIYAIVYKNYILYHNGAAKLTDQVTSGGIHSNVLTLSDLTKFPEATQTWTLTAAEGGFTVKSCSGADQHLNMNKVTADGSKVPVGAEAQAMTIAATAEGFTISRKVGNSPVYLARTTKQFFVSSAPCTLRLFKKTPVPPAPPADPLVIPGYTRVGSAALDASKLYMIVCKDSADVLYTFYPDAVHADADPGNAIDPGHKNHTSGCPVGCFVAKLTVAERTVTAQRTTVGAEAVAMDDLHLTVRAVGDQWELKFANNLYLGLALHMLSTSAATLAIRMNEDGTFALASENRTLSLNIKGDKTQFKAQSKTFESNFWGPRTAQLPIYLYTKDDASVTPEPPTVDKSALQAAITRAESLQSSVVYTQESRDLLSAPLASAKTELGSASSTLDSVKAVLPPLTRAMDALVPVDLAPERPVSATGTTEIQPFINDVTGGSHTFRIPALTKLNDGSLAAAIDARWDKCPDGYGIDTLFSRSTDDGKTWTYNFPNYFNDSVDAYYKNAAAFIDPLMVQGKDNTIYLMADVFPGGHYIFSVDKVSGFETIAGEPEKRMVLYTASSGQTGANYNYYIGAFTEQFAPVIAKGDSTKAACYYVDDHYYLYTADKKPMYCPQIGSSQYVKQNLFYKNATLHVRNATYLWLVTSTDNGQTWSAPTIMNSMVRPNPEHQFYGVGPGAGLCLDDGTILLPCYVSGRGQLEHASFVYNKPADKSIWYRSPDATQDRSSESVLVQLGSDKIRQIYRNDHNVVCYTDFNRNKSGDWTPGSLVEVPGAIKTRNNQVSAIRYSKQVNGRDLILVSTAATIGNGRNNGKIYTFALGQDAGRTMELISTYEVTKPGIYYGYSSMTEQRDGSIGLLYETGAGSDYLSLPVENVIQGISVNGKQSIVVGLYDTVENQDVVPTTEDLKQLNNAVVRAELIQGKVRYTGLQVGETQMTTASGVTVTIRITEPAKLVTVDTFKGESTKLTVEAGTITQNTAPGAATAEITTESSTVTVTNGAQGNTGTTAAYSGALEPLASALQVFQADGAGFRIYGKSGDSKVWLDPSAANGTPAATTPRSMVLDPQPDGTFFLRTTKGRYLAFWRDGKNVFDAANSAGGIMTPLCKFKLYCPALSPTPSSREISGYVQVTDVQDIQAGGSYLIVAQYGDTYYVLRPSMDSADKYAHVLQVNPGAEKVTSNITTDPVYTMTVSGVSVGTTDILVGGVVYRITVLAPYAPPVEPNLPNTVKNPDGSITTTVKQPNGTVVKTTQYLDGSSSSAEIRRDGVCVDTVTNTEGKTTAKVTIPTGVNSAIVTIPTAGATSSHVAVVVHPDGRREIIKTSIITKNGVQLTAKVSGKYEILDNAKTFWDVSGDHWAKDTISFLAAREIFNGTGAAAFSPELDMTRGMLVKVLHNLENTPDATATVAFEDVKDGTWFSDALQWAAGRDIVTGYGNGLFGAGDKLSREQLAVMLYRYAGKPVVSGVALQFTDANQVSDYASAAMIWAVENKIISSTSDNCLAPKEDASRAQAAAMLIRFLLLQK